MQSEQNEEQIILGSVTDKKTSINISLNSSSCVGRLFIDIKDDENRRLAGFAQLTDNAGKRVFISILPTTNRINIIEVNLYEAIDHNVNFLALEFPSAFSNFSYPLILSGSNKNGTRSGNFIGKAANLIIWKKFISREDVDELICSTSEEIQLFNLNRKREPKSIERQDVFIRDSERLKELASISSLSPQEMCDAVLIIYKWLFDTHPLLLDLCNSMGLQLSLPASNEKELEYIDRVLSLNPSFFQMGSYSGPFGFEWGPLSMFDEQVAFFVEGHRVRTEA